MKAPLSWLKDYVDIDCSAEELQAKLFSCGFEVEEMIYVGYNIKKIVTCKILESEKHPNADKLSVKQVDAGKYGKLQIVTNAKNIEIGDIVPVALDGAVLNNGETINAGEIRGVKSAGMFCSGNELGITDDWYKGASFDGVLVFREEFPLGEEVIDLLGVKDVIFDINVTANRPDCQSIFGIAREVAAVLGKSVKMPDLSFETEKTVSTRNTIVVEDKATDLCPRYISHLVKDVKIEESPDWIKHRLFSMGLRSINNIVDITNFVLLELGQPMHAFDLNDLQGNKIIIRRAENGEKIITLDEKEFSLTDENLVICDSVKPVALAGIMGGLNSEIKDTTKDIVFESAKFKRDNIRKSSRALGQRSDSSSRFEKGIDAYTTGIGMQRALHLISELKCGKIACDGYDLNSCSEELKVIKTTFSKVNGVLGIDVPKDKIEQILSSLNFKVVSDGDKLEVTVPAYREDMEDYPDIAEEIIREYGYDYINPTLLKTSEITNGGRNYAQKKVEDLKNLLVGYGFNEIITYSFVSEKEYKTFGLDKDGYEEKMIKIFNPLGEDMAVMRQSLLPSIVRTVAYNLNRKNNSGRLFELAKTYSMVDKEYKNHQEKDVLSFAMFGEEDFFTAKGVVEGILDTFCYGKKVEYLPCEEYAMHPTRSAKVMVDGKYVGYFGQIRPEINDKFDVQKEIFAGELYYDVLKDTFTDKITFKSLSKYPQVERDLAIIVDEKIAWADINNAVTEVGGEYLHDIKLFDIYRGGQIASDKKSVAFNLVFVPYERTLTVEEIDGIIKGILLNLREKLGAELR